MSKSKPFKNPNRNQKPAPNKYVPFYQEQGIEPVEFIPNKVQASTSPTTRQESPVVFASGGRRRESFTEVSRNRSNLPYAEMPIFPPTGSPPIPNVGNNFETSFTDFSTFDDESLNNEIIDPNMPMIDNNFASEELTTPDVNSQLDIGENDYVLLIDGSVVSTGDSSFIENEIYKLIMGKHHLSMGEPVDIEDMIVLKRVQFKTGVVITD